MSTLLRRYFDLASPASLVPLSVPFVVGLAWACATYAIPTDFQAFVDAARALRAGLDPYGAYTVQFAVPFPNLNPPFSLFFIAPLADADPWIAQRVWYWTTIALYAANCWLLLRLSPTRATIGHVAWLLALAGFWHSLQSKNLYIPLATLTTVTWVLLRRHHASSAALLIGLMAALKPNLLIWPALLYLAGHRRVAVVAGGTAGAASLLALVAFGPNAYQQWWAATRLYARPELVHNGSLFAAFDHLGLAHVSWAGSTLMLVGVALVVWRRRPPAGEASAIAIAAALLAAPLAWIGYSLLLLPALLERPWRRAFRAAAVLLVLPPPNLVSLTDRSPVLMATLGLAYPAAFCLVLAGLVANGSPIGATQSGTVVPLPRGVPLATLGALWRRCAASGVQTVQRAWAPGQPGSADPPDRHGRDQLVGSGAN
ncbi:MAG TPA: glycosyltransferase family 87 protein [Chloroflexota bacterium]|nr:glycosyltransferase family 87 protein [Chloroflexota bacterium]